MIPETPLKKEKKQNGFPTYQVPKISASLVTGICISFSKTKQDDLTCKQHPTFN